MPFPLRWFPVTAVALMLTLKCSAQPPGRPIAAYDITDYGAIGDGATLNTTAIQNTIDSCAIHGGGKIIIPPGNLSPAPCGSSAISISASKRGQY